MKIETSQNLLEISEDGNPNSVSKIIIKTLGIILLFILSVIMGILPLKMKIFQTNLRVTGIVNSLSAGIFVSVSLLHLLPEAHENFMENTPIKFPLAFLIAILSYTFILIIEKLAFDTHKWLEVHVHPDIHHHDHKKSKLKQKKHEASTFLVSVKGNYTCCDETTQKDRDGEMQKIQSNACDDLMDACSHDEYLEKADHQIKENEITENEVQTSLKDEKINSPGLMKNANSPPQLNLKPQTNSIPNSWGYGYLDEPFLNKKNLSYSFAEDLKRQQERKHSELIYHQSNKNRDFDEANFKELLSTKANLAKTISYHDKHRKKHKLKQKRLDEEAARKIESGDEAKPQTRNIGKYTPYVLLMALSFHGIFEGIAIGIQRQMSQILNLLLAVALHKWAEALTLGMSFNKNESRKNLSIRMILLFSSTGPLGIGVGWALTQSSPVISAAFMSISAGTFLYISASELVVEEFSISKNKWLKLLFFLVGVGIIAGLWFLEENE